MMRIKHWLFIGIILFGPVVKADKDLSRNNFPVLHEASLRSQGKASDKSGSYLRTVPNSTFIGGYHFVQDSAIVLFNGVVVSTALEAICCIAVPVSQGRTSCQHFAPEATTFLYQAKKQWPTDAMEVWSSLNIAFFAIAMVYIRHDYGSLVSKVHMAVNCMTYSQVAQMMAKTTFHYLTGSNQTHLPVYAPVNSLSTGLIAGGLVLWFMYKQTSQYRPFYWFMASAGTTLIFTPLHFYLQDLDKMNFSQKAAVGVGAAAAAGTVAAAGTLAVAVSRVGAVARAEDIAVAIPIAGAVTVVGAEAIAEAEAIAFAIARVGAASTAGVAAVAAGTAAGTVVATVGVYIIMLTGNAASALRQWTTESPIKNNLIMMAAVGLPLMVNSWITSWSRFVESDTSAHDTMQDEFIFPLNKLSAFYPENWMSLFQVWERSTD